MTNQTVKNCPFDPEVDGNHPVGAIRTRFETLIKTGCAGLRPGVGRLRADTIRQVETLHGWRGLKLLKQSLR